MNVHQTLYSELCHKDRVTHNDMSLRNNQFQPIEFNQLLIHRHQEIESVSSVVSC